MNNRGPPGLEEGPIARGAMLRGMTTSLMATALALGSARADLATYRGTVEDSRPPIRSARVPSSTIRTWRRAPTWR
jgi:hypothetical protein